MFRNECEYSRDISMAIEQCRDTSHALRKIVEDAKAANTVSILAQTLVIHQKTLIDLLELRRGHQDSCDICDS